MEILLVLTFLMLLVTSVCFIYAWYQLHRAQKHIRDAIKICEDAVQSLRAGRG